MRENPDERGVLLTLDADLTEDAKYGRRRLILTPEELKVEDPTGARLLVIPISEVATARNDPLVSGGRLVAELKNGEHVAVVHYSQTHSDDFAEAARGIEQLAKGEEFMISLKREKTRCEKCGRLLPEKDGICPRCLNRGKTLTRLASFLKPHLAAAGALTGFALFATLLNLVPPRLQGYVVDLVDADKGGIDTLVGFMPRNGTSFFTLVGIWFGILVLGTVLQAINGRLMAYLGSRISGDLRIHTYKAIEYLQIAYFDKKPTGAIASRVTQDTERVWHFLVDGLPFLLINSLMLAGVLTMLFLTNWVLAICILAPFPIVLLISMSVWRPIANKFHRASQKMARVHMHLGESLMGIRVVKAFAREDHEYNRFVTRSNELRDASNHAEQSWITAFAFMSLATSAGMVINWTVGGWMVFNGTLTLGEFWTISAYVALVYGPLQWFAQINNWFTRAMAGAERIFELMDMVPEGDGGSQKLHDVKGRITFDEVRFGYDPSNPIIKSMSFDVQPGEMIGLVGHSGSGKSTTINLVSRFYEPNKGRILVDGVDIKDLSLQEYREQIGIVLQDPFLFHGTIAENISYGKPGASMEEIMRAAKAANAHHFILAKPEGYDTVVGERGARLSGGEKQRISIARAILHDPRILILDEATSSVDVETERMIQEAIQNLVKGRTTFAIAHRLSTLRNADRIFVLDRGEIIEQGTHEELMTRNGAFKKLVDTQTELSQVIGAIGGGD
ncbi:MAG: ABC transporter ATP-binding protein/permease [Fimbriimonadaceae bacterium]|nr:ABC transporter ATP-binding protein/permease [Fimbriimonadaceae bacterium]